MNQVIKKIEAGQEIGSFVWYDVEGCSIRYDDLVTVFDEEGLDHKYLPPSKIRPENALKKVKAKINGRRKSLNVIIEEIEVDKDFVTYGVVDPALDTSHKEINFTHMVTIELDINNNALSVTNKIGNDDSVKIGNTTIKDLKVLIVDMFNDFSGNLISRDITRMVVRALKKMYVVSLRRGGGSYYVPISYKDDLDALRRVFNRISQSRMEILTLTNKNGNVDTISNAAKSQDALKFNVEDLLEEISNVETDVRQMLDALCE